MPEEENIRKPNISKHINTKHWQVISDAILQHL